jgi:hypothetical protein
MWLSKQKSGLLYSTAFLGLAADTQHSEPCFMYEAEKSIARGQDDQKAESRSAEGSSTTHNNRYFKVHKTNVTVTLTTPLYIALWVSL